jgi:hypothetical protein
MQAHHPHKPKFPRRLGRFFNLEGGLYGSLELVAITCETLELLTGEDFVRFDRAQAKNLRDVIDRFLALDADSELEEIVEVVVEDQRPREREQAPQPRRKKRAS